MSGFTYSHSSLSSFRRCPRKYFLSYDLRLTPLADREALTVGSCWHESFEQPEGTEFYSWFYANAPSELWAEKLYRLHAAHRAIYEGREGFEVVEVEHTFEREMACIDSGHVVKMRGQIDLKIRMPDGRVGILERKTTGAPLDDESMYWDVLAHGTQVGIYGLAADRPDVILYDVVRKPTIRPKAVKAADVRAWTEMIEAEGEARGVEYFGEAMPPEEIAYCVAAGGKETTRMFGARLADDIVSRPEYYFSRREVSRTDADYDRLVEDLHAQVGNIERMREADADGSRCAFYRNPDACDDWGGCEFRSICWTGEIPENGTAPAGFRVRTHRHPELDGEDSVANTNP